MKVILTYRDGFRFVPNDGLEIDLDGPGGEDLFSIVIVDDNCKPIFSAYHWDNRPFK